MTSRSPVSLLGTEAAIFLSCLNESDDAVSQGRTVFLMTLLRGDCGIRSGLFLRKSEVLLRGHLSPRPCTFSVGCPKHDFDPEEGTFTPRSERMEAELLHVTL